MMNQRTVLGTMRRVVVAAGAMLAAGVPAFGAGRERPNIVIILADDMGFSDIGCYGSEIPTPNIDALAERGVRFNQFYNYGRCCPTRAALMTGLYPHQAGMGWMTGTVTEHPGYQGTLSKQVPTVAEVMKGAGYATYMTGKWHLTSAVEPGDPPDTWPVGRGFDRFYGTIKGGGNYFDPGTLTRDATPVDPLADEQYKPEGQYYYTTAIGEQAARFVREHKGRSGEKPFFMYVAFTAPHWPLHAPAEAVAKYKGKYDGGYGPIREARLGRQREMGVIPAGMVAAPLVGDWNGVEDKAWEARCMEVYAAQVDLMDREVGRVVSALREAGEFDDTVVMFLSDNGGCAEETGRSKPRPERRRVAAKPDAQAGGYPQVTRGGEAVGRGPGVMPGPETTYLAYGEGWANVSNAPFREYKSRMHEGGIATPLVVSWPKGIGRHGEWEGQVGSVIDLMATAAELAGVKDPPRTEGVSLVPALRGEPVTRERPIFWEHQGNRAVRDGRWKLVAKGVKGAWELYDVEADRGERNDLAESEGTRVKELAAKWQAWAARANVLPIKGYAKGRAAGE